MGSTFCCFNNSAEIEYLPNRNISSQKNNSNSIQNDYCEKTDHSEIVSLKIDNEEQKDCLIQNLRQQDENNNDLKIDKLNKSEKKKYLILPNCTKNKDIILDDQTKQKIEIEKYIEAFRISKLAQSKGKKFTVLKTDFLKKKLEDFM